MDDGFPGAAKNTRGEALAALIPPLKGEGPARSAGGGVASQYPRNRTLPGSP